MLAFEIIIILLCVSLNAFLACFEVAFITVDKSELRGLAERGSPAGEKILELKQKPEQILSVIQIGITFVGAFAAAIGGAGAQVSLTPWLTETVGISPKVSEILSTLVIVLPITYLNVVFGELVPKTIALRSPLKSALKLVHFLTGLRRVLYPIALTLEWSTHKIVDFLSFSRGKSGDNKDLLSSQGKEYIANVVKIDGSQVSCALIEWDSVATLSVDASDDVVERAFITSGHTRLPVLDGEVVKGHLNYKEYFALQKAEKGHWISLVRPPVLIQETQPLLSAFKTLQKQSAHLGIVHRQDKPVGIITIEDILEEIVGEIYDEDDYGSIKNILKHTRFLR